MDTRVVRNPGRQYTYTSLAAPHHSVPQSLGHSGSSPNSIHVATCEKETLWGKGCGAVKVVAGRGAWLLILDERREKEEVEVKEEGKVRPSGVTVGVCCLQRETTAADKHLLPQFVRLTHSHTQLT